MRLGCNAMFRCIVWARRARCRRPLHTCVCLRLCLCLCAYLLYGAWCSYKMVISERQLLLIGATEELQLQPHTRVFPPQTSYS
jgi:hypothetical protein